MGEWSTDSVACKTLWTSLYSMQQLHTSFEESGTTTIGNLTFFNSLSSGDSVEAEAKVVADQLDNIFTNGRGATYETGIDATKAISGLVSILSDKDKMVQDLATEADSLYKFWGE